MGVISTLTSTTIAGTETSKVVEPSQSSMSMLPIHMRARMRLTKHTSAVADIAAPSIRFCGTGRCLRRRASTSATIVIAATIAYTTVLGPAVMLAHNGAVASGVLQASGDSLTVGPPTHRPALYVVKAP